LDLKGGRKEKVFGSAECFTVQKKKVHKFLGLKENLKNEEEKIDIFLKSWAISKFSILNNIEVLEPLLLGDPLRTVPLL